MNKKTLKALEGSILKWEKIVDGSGEDRGVRNCPLCKLFYFDECEGCPVMDATNRPYCNGTPYIYFLVARRRIGVKEERKQAINMLSFLKSLLPRED